MPCYEIDGVVPVVHPTAYLHPSADLIGDVIVGPNCYIGPSASLRGDFGRILVAGGSNIQDHCVLHAFPGTDTVLESESHIGHGAILHGCHLEPQVLVGMNAVIMDGARIGTDSLIGAASMVKAGTVVPARSLVVGNPARVVRQLDEQTRAWKANGARTYQALTGRCHASLRPAEPMPEADDARRALRVSADASVARPLHELRADSAAAAAEPGGPA